MENPNPRSVQQARHIIQQRAQEAAAAPNVAERAASGARALLPGEILRPAAVEQGTLWLELAITHRCTIIDGALDWDRGMDEIGPDLLALAGCESGVRELAISRTRAALVRQYRTPLEDDLIRLLSSAASIAMSDSTVFSARVVSLFQTKLDHEVERWRPISGARIKYGPVEVAVLPGPDGEVAAVELRLRQGCWRLPATLGEALVERFKTL